MIGARQHGGVRVDEARYRYEVYWYDGGLRVYEQHEVRDAVHEVSRVARAGSAEAEGER